MEDTQTKESQDQVSQFRRVASIGIAIICGLITEVAMHTFSTSLMSPESLGRVTLVSCFLYILHRFTRVSVRRYQPRYKDVVTLAVLLISMVCVFTIGKAICVSLIGQFGDSLIRPTVNLSQLVDPSVLFFAIPFAAGGIIVQLCIGPQYGLLFGLALSGVIGTHLPEHPHLVLYIFITTVAGCLSMRSFRSRSAYVKAGLIVGCVGVLLAFCIGLMVFQGSIIALVLGCLAAICGGVLTVFLIAGITPVVESLGGYVTDMTLLEMATLDHPLLKELSISAPGTWNHSMVMGMMAERAATSVRANPVLVRVSCYFHDIGKMKSPLYFVENQGRGENRHDKLSPSMSALIIRSHVKDGIKMAEQHKLPRVIMDMIPQHHGTSLIEYFYDKALKEAQESEDQQDVDPSLYTYPGPKPQTKEAGIIMLADGIEAAARTLKDPSLDKIQGLVQKMINKVFASGELNECPLTLQDLHQIAREFTHVLSGIHHQRIAYPESVEKEKNKEKSKDEQKDGSIKKVVKKKVVKKIAKKEEQENDSEVERPSSDNDKNSSNDKSSEDKKNNGDNLKRLGL